ncbi:Aspartate/methionine/tyrosine aminotransferase [Alkalispirochaeta americana]|uniref:Aspartate/methionine/tyrosine aminotransferase n=1 Tax=Alkalispirochaeta americana TaxID=159291 RepID=A0A1N6S3R8_9SPIO|nr:pyridoxal phosphate-dependent aminotransferase [Alkalispirochaeta americana]SIQ35602.1 Aspartate/methionine/tyrosine aminotransferase [Alkalispirochaeta americana]
MKPITPLEAARRELLRRDQALRGSGHHGSNGAGYIDLTNSSFSAGGLSFPEPWYQASWERWRARREYRPSGAGDHETRQGIARYLEADGLPAGPDQILLTSGSSVSYSLIFQHLREEHPRRNALVALPVPGYPLLEEVVTSAGLSPLGYHLSPREGFSCLAPAIETVLRHDPLALVLVSPNNPTGAIYPPEELRELFRVCSLRGCSLLCDEVFSSFRPPGTALPRPATFARESELPLFTLNGLSKLCAAPEVKLGWIAIHGAPAPVDRARDRLDTLHDTYLTVSGFAEAAGLIFLSPEAASDRETLARTVGRRRSLARELLATLPQTSFPGEFTPGGGIHLPFRLEATFCAHRFGTLDDEAIAIRLLHETGVLVHPGYLYGLDRSVTGELDPWFVATCLNREETLSRGFHRLAQGIPGTVSPDDSCPEIPLPGET